MTQTSEERGSSPALATRQSDRGAGSRQFGPWQLLYHLGGGAMADVYAACPQGQSSDGPACYAVKVLKAEWHDRPAAVDLMRREVLAAQAVSSPHVVSILDWHLRGTPYYLVMPRLVGSTLADMLAGEEPPPVPVALWIARQVAEGLEALAGAGWMHSDVKPANIFVAADGHATLFDLGLVRRPAEAAPRSERPVVGTLDYMAPEMLTSALAPDIRSDIYSLGVVLYQMLTGRLPYEGRGPVEIVQMQRAGVPDRLRCLAPLLPPGVVQLIRSMLAHEPLRRPQTPREMIARLVSLEIETLAERIPA